MVPLHLNETFDKKLIELFQIKKTWILNELVLFMNGMGYSNNYLIEKISRKTRLMEEKCFFIEYKMISIMFLK